MGRNIVKYTLDENMAKETSKLWVIVPSQKHVFEVVECNPKIKKVEVIKKKKKKSRYPFKFKIKQKALKYGLKECTDCGSDRYLQVHHIDKNKFNNEDSNLKLLCFDCHKKIHAHLYLPSFLKV